MSSSNAIDPSICDGIEGCGGVFPRKGTPGLCVQCALINEYERKGEVHRVDEYKSYPQCQDCGAIGKNFRNELCGKCIRARGVDDPLAGRQAQVIADMEAARAAATQHRGHNGRFTKAPPLPNIAALPASSATTRQTTGRVALESRAITVNFRVWASNKKDGKIPWLGNCLRSFPADEKMDNVIDEYIKTLNPSWEKHCTSSLRPEDCEVRLHGNYIPEEALTNDETLGDFFDKHKATEHRDVYFAAKTPNEARSLKGRMLSLLLFIDVEKFEQRTGIIAPCRDEGEIRKLTKLTALSKTRKRQGVPISSDDEEPPRKRHGAIAPLVSTYVPFGRAMQQRRLGTSASAPATTSDVLLQLARLDINMTDGTFNISFTESATYNDSKIEDTSCASGVTKRVYKATLTMNGTLRKFMAKRFYQIRAGQDHVSVHDNAQLLEREAERLYIGKYFLQKFYDRAREVGVEVAEGLEFSTCMLAREVLNADNQDSTPSPASGVTQEQWENLSFDEQSSGIMWLLEPERSSTVQRWSGTLQHPEQMKNKIGATVTAFAHFAYLFSHRTMVFADIQSSAGRLEDRNERGTILFDVMTHTTEGDSGLGDHGEQGIEVFVKTHTCNVICKSFGFGSLQHPRENWKRIRAQLDAGKYEFTDADIESEHEVSENEDEMRRTMGLSQVGQYSSDQE